MSIMCRCRISPRNYTIKFQFIQEEHLVDDDESDKNEFVISYELTPSPLVATETSETTNPSSVDTMTLKGSSSNMTLIRNKRKRSNDRDAEQPKIEGKHKNYFECDECKNGFSTFDLNRQWAKVVTLNYLFKNVFLFQACNKI